MYLISAKQAITIPSFLFFQFQEVTIFSFLNDEVSVAVDVNLIDTLQNASWKIMFLRWDA